MAQNTPTQAQIEAATKVLKDYLGPVQSEVAAIRALTAAAVTKPTQAQIEAAAEAMMRDMFAPHELPLDDELRRKYLHTATAALTAAAEMGEQQPDDTFAHGACVMKERCAQVADKAAHRAMMEYATKKDYGYLWCSDEAKDIAAAIRALKGKP